MHLNGGIWTSNFDERIRADLSGTTVTDYVYFSENGANYVFDGSTFTPNLGTDGQRLAVSASDPTLLLLSLGSGEVRSFSKITDTLYLLTSVRWPDGYTVTIGRDATDHRVLQISDNRGQSATLTWDAAAFSGAMYPLVSGIDLAWQGVTQSSLQYQYAANSIVPWMPLLLKEHQVPAGGGADLRLRQYSYAVSMNYFPPVLTATYDGRQDSAGAVFAYSEATYDTNGLVTSTQLAGGADRNEFSQPSTGVIQVTNPLGKLTNYTMTAADPAQAAPSGRISTIDGVATANCLGTAQSFDYGGGIRVASQTERNGSITTFERNIYGQLTRKVEDSTGTTPRESLYTYNSSGQLLTEQGAGLLKSYVYDAQGLLTSYSQTDKLTGSPTYGQVRTWTLSYTTLASGLKVLTTLDGPGLSSEGVTDVTTFTYDSTGNLATTTDPLGLVTTVSQRNALGLPTLVTHPNATVTATDYDLLGRVVASGTGPTGATPAKTQYVYDIAGQVTSLTNTLGKTWTFAYDGARRLASSTGPTGDVATYTYDAMGNVTRVAYSNGGSAATFWHDTAFDELGRILEDIAAGGQTWTMAHDVEDNLSKITDPLSNVETRGYDALNRLTTIVDRAGHTTGLSYTLADDLSQYTDPRSLQTGLTYDGFGEVIKEVSPDRGTQIFTYNTRGLLATSTDARGYLIKYSYNNAGQITKIDFPTGTVTDFGFQYNVTQGNSDAGSLAKYTGNHDAGQPTHSYSATGTLYSLRTGQKSAGTNEVTKVFYDTEGQPSWMTYPFTNDRIDYTRDDAGRVTAVKLKLGGTGSAITLLDQIQYLPSGPISSMVYGDGSTETRSYDHDYQLTGLVDVKGTVTLRSLLYGYEARGNLASVTAGPSAPGAPSGGTSTVTPVAAGTDNYSYPTTSNRLAAIASTGGTSRTLAYDASGNVTSDARGSDTYAYTYDANGTGRLASLSVNGVQQGQYAYNYLGQQVRRTLSSSGTSIRNIFEPGGNRIAEIDGSTYAVTREYVWLGDMPIAVIEGGQVYYVRSDHIGRPVFATDSSGAKVWELEYFDFGGVKASWVSGAVAPSTLRFPGQWYQAESGLHQNGMRDYDPTTGRYIEADPLGVLASVSLYGYAGQNPANWTDPRGEQSISLPDGGIGPFPFGPMSVRPGMPLGDALGQSLNRDVFPLVGSILRYCATSIITPLGDGTCGEGCTNVVSAKAPGVPGTDDGFFPPKGWNGRKTQNPNGAGYGYPDKKGNVWIPTGEGAGAHGGPHWDVQHPGGGYTNVYPGGRTR